MAPHTLPVRLPLLQSPALRTLRPMLWPRSSTPSTARCSANVLPPRAAAAAAAAKHAPYSRSYASATSRRWVTSIGPTSSGVLRSSPGGRKSRCATTRCLETCREPSSRARSDETPKQSSCMIPTGHAKQKSGSGCDHPWRGGSAFPLMSRRCAKPSAHSTQRIGTSEAPSALVQKGRSL